MPEANPDKEDVIQPTVAGDDSDSDSEEADVFHDARFPADEEAVSSSPPITISIFYSSASS